MVNNRKRNSAGLIWLGGVSLIILFVAGMVAPGAGWNALPPEEGTATFAPNPTLSNPTLVPSESPIVPSDPTIAPSDPTNVPTLLSEVSPDPSPVPVTSSPPPRSASRTPIRAPTSAVATRVVVSTLGIDLPVMRQTTRYPACNVAMYLSSLKQPGQGGVTYLYAHARRGMFLPLLNESRVNNGARMVGMTVDVYNGLSTKFSYRVVEVRRHVTSLAGAVAWRGESLWLQTSEGPGATFPKLQLVAKYVSSADAAFEEAHPDAYPVNC